MAANPGKPPNLTFAEVLQKDQISHNAASGTGRSHQYKGEPAIHFTKQEVDSLSVPLKYTLIGKFITTRPSMEYLRKGFQTIGFKGDIKLGLLDHRHILIRFQIEEDFHRCWLRSSWHFHQYTMRVLRWTPTFRVEEEPSMVPIWVNFDRLPLFLFHQEPLFSLGRAIGNPLKMDVATQNLTRPSVARLCVEVDILQPLPKRIWIGDEQDGFWQAIRYDEIPSYCSTCKSIGHENGNCNKPKVMWKPKAKQDVMQNPVAKKSTAGNSSGLSTKEKLQTMTHTQSHSSLMTKQKDIAAKEIEVMPRTDQSTNTQHKEKQHTTTSLWKFADEDIALLQNLMKDPNISPQVDLSKATKEYEDMLKGKPASTSTLTRSASSIRLQTESNTPSKADLLSYKEEIDTLFHTHLQLGKQNEDQQHFIKKSRPRKNYWNIPKTISTRSQGQLDSLYPLND